MKTAKVKGQGLDWCSFHSTPIGNAEVHWSQDRIRSVRIQVVDVETRAFDLSDRQERLTTEVQHAFDLFFEAKPNPIPWELLDLDGRTEFQHRVLFGCFQIPLGETRSYQELAQIAGSPLAARAVGSVMSSNKIPLFIPCHRVLGSGKSFGGYSARGGLETKRWLLDRESRS